MTDAVTRALAAIEEMREHLAAALAPYPHLRVDLSAYAPDGAVSLILNGNGRSVRVLLVGEHEIADESYKLTFSLRIGLAIEVYAQSGPPAVTTQYLKAALPGNPLASPTGETWTKVAADGVTHGTSLGAVIGEAVARDAARDKQDRQSWQKTRDEALAELGFQPDSEHLPSCALRLAERLETAEKTARSADENVSRALQSFAAWIAEISQ